MSCTESEFIVTALLPHRNQLFALSLEQKALCARYDVTPFYPLLCPLEIYTDKTAMPTMIQKYQKIFQTHSDAPLLESLGIIKEENQKNAPPFFYTDEDETLSICRTVTAACVTSDSSQSIPLANGAVLSAGRILFAFTRTKPNPSHNAPHSENAVFFEQLPLRQNPYTVIPHSEPQTKQQSERMRVCTLTNFVFTQKSDGENTALSWRQKESVWIKCN